ncbi:MAG TPA: hypothetical protein VIJ25_10655, partial [Methylococcales bacterium]
MFEKIRTMFLIVVMSVLSMVSNANGWFGNQPPLGPRDESRHLFKPYDLVKLNYLGANYCENLFDKRVGLTSYTHLNFDINTWDAYNLQFPDDNARFIESLVFEDRYSPVVRLELVRRVAKGIMAARYPATKAYYNFKYRNDGKSLLIFDDKASTNQGRLTLTMCGDTLEGYLKIGFRAHYGGNWQNIEKFKYTDEPNNAGSIGVARLPQYWNESPYVFKRHYTSEDKKVDFTGKYWL